MVRLQYDADGLYPDKLGGSKSKVDAWKSQGETVVFTNGCFDILHKGHITYLQQAAALGEHLIIGLNADESVKKLKGEGRPVNSESDRAFMLNSLRFVDEVVIFNEETPLELLKCLEPDILVKAVTIVWRMLLEKSMWGKSEYFLL